ncbi:MAG TPA: M36 family metallopeptidase [Labilithrix sp.]|nr:M36 family metallopeptidase [Labilithrix sp.]
MRSRALLSSALLTIFAASCSGSDRPDRASAPDDGTVAHRDPRLAKAPSFVWLNAADAPSFASPSEAAVEMLPSITRAFGVTAVASVAVAHVGATQGGPVITRYEQHVGALEVFRGGVNLVLSQALRPIAASGFLAPTERGSERPFVLGSSDALAIGARLVGRVLSFSPTIEKNGYERFAAAGLLGPARVKKVLFPVDGDSGVELEPAYYVEILLAAGPARAWVVSATDGRVLFENDLVHHDAFSYRVYADPETKVPMPGPQGHAFSPHPTGLPDKKKLAFLPSQLVTLQNYPFSKNDPWLAPGATTTAGNNVEAYADLAEPDGFNAATDMAPALTATATFDNVYDTGASPKATPASIQAATAHLFYVTNFLHDWFYDAGFDEASRNHQFENFGRGGKDGDPLLAEAQDNSGRNNANALVPPDGMSPRIQMFVFSGASNASLVVGAPASIAGTKSVGIASGFGKDVFDVSGTVVLGADGTGADPSDGCEAPESDVTGKIVLVHRGTCSFAQKTQVAQESGAIGLLIANVPTSANPTFAPFMGGQQDGLTIPVLSLSFADGQALESSIPAGATVTMKRSLSSDLDGALDTTIVAHEWGHVLSNRLIGNGLGLRTNQAGGLGEGWGDFTALLVNARADDPTKFAGTYANGAYATSGSGDDVYFGTRRVPYSIDFSKNALTLKHISNGTPLPANVPTSFGEDGSFNAEVHSTGEVWATMLWECYASLLREGRLSFAEAQDRMKVYLVASLKLTPPDPTIIEARDALLSVALARDEQDFQVFWKAFARRGAGAGAVGPAKDSSSNQGVTESYESGNDLKIVETKIADDVISCDHDGILDEGEVGTVEITVQNTGSGFLAAPTAQLSSATNGVRVLDAGPTPLAALAPFASTKAKLKARVNASKSGEPIELDVAVTDPALPAARVVRVALPTRYDADEAAQSSAIDRVNTTKTVWKVTGDGDGEKWARSSPRGDGFWTIADPMQPADHKLASPAFTIDATTFTLAFKHKWAFKRSTRRNVDLDGGVIEVSTDQGKTWKDISTYGAVDYNVTLDNARTENPLNGRKAYGSKSPGYPDQWISSRIDVTLPAHPETVLVRFRVGAGFGRAGADGWAIDDIELIGASSTPFPSYVPHADACDPNGPTTDAGVPQVVAARANVTLTGSATHPAELPLTYLWSQVEGPAVVLRDDATLNPSFEAPDAKVPVKLTFALRAHDGALLSPASRVDVYVDPAAPPRDASVVDGGCACRATPSSRPATGLGVTLFALGALFARRRRRRAFSCS